MKQFSEDSGADCSSSCCCSSSSKSSPKISLPSSVKFILKLIEDEEEEEEEELGVRRRFLFLFSSDSCDGCELIPSSSESIISSFSLCWLSSLTSTVSSIISGFLGMFLC